MLPTHNMKIDDNLIEKVRQLFQSQSEQSTLKQNLQALLSAQLKKMDVVSREEFDAQTAVLERTRQKLDSLEKQFAELEK